jgi:hypothetical protein
MVFDAAQLDEFSGSFAQALFAVHPGWTRYARVEIADNGETPDLVVEVPSPVSADVTEKLVVTTEDTEITISFVSYHSHFGWPVDDPDWSINPLSFIAAILNEDVAAVSGWNGDKWAGSWLIERDEKITPPNNCPAMATIRVRSWCGSLDQDILAS